MINSVIVSFLPERSIHCPSDPTSEYCQPQHPQLTRVSMINSVMKAIPLAGTAGATVRPASSMMTAPTSKPKIENRIEQEAISAYLMPVPASVQLTLTFPTGQNPEADGSSSSNSSSIGILERARLCHSQGTLLEQTHGSQRHPT